jgi:hypothetical protein
MRVMLELKTSQHVELSGKVIEFDADVVLLRYLAQVPSVRQIRIPLDRYCRRGWSSVYVV